MDLLPWADVGVAVIIFTVIVKIILFPLSKSALLAQARMKEVDPDVAKIRVKYADDKQVQAVKTMELYKEKGIRPFAGILLLFIQLPILFALITVFYKIIPSVQPGLLYSFVAVPHPKTYFLGLIDLAKPSLVLSIATAAVQFLQLQFSLASKQAAATPKGASGAAAMASSMNTQMKFLVPLLAFTSTYWIIPARFPEAASVIAIYWMTSSAATFFQELYIRKKHMK